MAIKKKSVAILGSTGSIGINTLEIIDKYPKIFSVNLLCCNSNKNLIIKQIKKFLPKFVIINDYSVYKFVKKKKFKKKIFIYNNIDFLHKKVKKKFDYTILGISGIDGFDYALTFIKKSNSLLLANKETIVCGGRYFLKKASTYKCKIVPIDSEHYCIFNAISCIDKKEIDKIYLTASGGPFLNKNYKDYYKANLFNAIKHPKWKMGKKISIDSATMSNKALELMEACILFDLSPEKVKIKIHKESKVHSAIILKNGLVKLIAHNTTMKIPIENSLIKNNIFLKKNFFYKKKFFSLTFDELNLKKFPMVSLGYKAISLGERGCIFFNVINDYLVNSYMNREIFFYEISKKLNKVINAHEFNKYLKKKIYNLKDIYETISYSKNIAEKI